MSRENIVSIKKLLGDDGETLDSMPLPDTEQGNLAKMSDFEDVRNLIGNFCLTAGVGKYRSLIFCDFIEGRGENSDCVVMNRFGYSIIHLSEDDPDKRRDFKNIISATAERSGRILPLHHGFLEKSPGFSFLVADEHSRNGSIKLGSAPVETEDDAWVVKRVMGNVDKRIEHFNKNSQERINAQEEVRQIESHVDEEIRELLNEEAEAPKRKKGLDQ